MNKARLRKRALGNLTAIERKHIKRIGLFKYLTDYLVIKIRKELRRSEEIFWGVAPDSGFLEEGC